MRRLLDWDGRRWVAMIRHLHTTDSDLAACRDAMEHSACEEVWGPTRESVAFPTPDFVTHSPGVGGALLGSTGKQSVPYLEDYFRLLTALEQSPEEIASGADIDWSIVSRSWGASVQIVLNAPRFPSGMATDGYSIYEDMTRFSAKDVEATLERNQAEGDPGFSERPSAAFIGLVLWARFLRLLNRKRRS